MSKKLSVSDVLTQVVASPAPVWYRHQRNYDWSLTFAMPRKVNGQFWAGRSLTKPDDSLTIHAILDRYVKGLAIPRTPMMNADIDLSEYDHMDKFERLEAARLLADRTRDIEGLALARKRDAAAKRDAESRERAVKSRVEEELEKARNVKS